MVPYVLGLDLGPTSIGWALLGQEGDREVSLVDAGVRIFPEGVDRDTKGLEKSKNMTRREARGARRIKERRRRRKGRLVAILKEAGLWPDDDQSFRSLCLLDPYELRAKALDERLAPHELGRVLYHLNQRRGFKSNRKSGKSREDGKVLKSITELEEQIASAKCRTLGEYLHRLGRSERIRNRYTRREMYQREFDLIWARQTEYHGPILSDELKKKLADEVIFFQLPLRVQDELIGFCEFETDQRRCPKADWHAQQFRMLQDINNLQIINPDGSSMPLAPDQRQTLVEVLGTRAKMDFDQIRKALGLLETQTFNYEEGKRKSLKGNLMEAGLAKAFGRKRWAEMQAHRDRITEALLEIEDPNEFRRIAGEEWAADDEQIEALLKIDLPDGYLHLSKKAILKLLPFMEQGERMADAVKKAGYLRPDQKAGDNHDRLPQPPDIRNPIVKKSLHEVRKVVNAIIREYGKPARIVVELARDMHGSVDDRNELHLRMLKNEREREEVRESIRSEYGITNPGRDDIQRLRLWNEQGQTCPYTGNTIARSQLFSSDVQVDHILPYPRSLDDSMMNKVVCFTSANREKGNQTPQEWLAAFPDRYERMLQAIKPLPWRKRRKFTQQAIDLGQCIDRQLNDTRYISREVRRYLQSLVMDVDCTRGQVTAELRHHWGLNQILNHTGGFTKNRDDHRHHAVDAVVVALTTPSHLQQLARTKGIVRDPLPFPWERFRDDVANRINDINVSFRPLRKVYGALHEETAYGPTAEENVYAYRKSVRDLKGPMIAQIVDPAIRNLVMERLKQKGLDPNNPPSNIPTEVFAEPLTMPSGVPVKKVRIRDTFTNLIPMTKMKTRTGKPYRYVKPGSNHHIEIFEYTDAKRVAKRDGVVVSMFDAAQRVQRGLPLINRDHGSGRRFVMSLSTNELVHVKVDGQYVLYRVQKLDAGNTRVILRLHTDSRVDDPRTVLRKSPNTLDGYKVTVDYLGRMRPAND
ncbi:MAG: type II CRISPR RNA-guided endonuclease Cas9 [Phycisphaerae bacterium]|nr:type II CRISPR RNA-guided endonuclease Cas9 [Phycisphaerae bacterium]